jgi:hypothetical protein
MDRCNMYQSSRYPRTQSSPGTDSTNTQSSQQVVIYIGESRDNSDLAMDCISEIHASFYYSREDRILRLETDMLQQLPNRLWFNRLRVLQEVVMSQSAAVFCGGKSVPWAALISFNTWNISSHWIERIPYVVGQISDDDSSRPIEEILRRQTRTSSLPPKSPFHGFYRSPSPFVLFPLDPCPNIPH